MGRVVSTLAEGLAFLEGPRWHDGALIASDMYGRRVLRFAADGSQETICEVPARPSGLAWDEDGHLLVASMADRRILRLRGGELQVHADLSEVVPGDVNDMIGDGRGGVYIGNFGFGPGENMAATHLVHVANDGTVRKVTDGLVFPNGMAITPDGRTLLVAETFASRVSAFDIDSDGSLSNRQEWAVFGDAPYEIDPLVAAASGVPLPDGICLDAEGAVWIADAAGGGAFRVAPGGAILDQIQTPGHSVFAVELGGGSAEAHSSCAQGRRWALSIWRSSAKLAYWRARCPSPASPVPEPCRHEATATSPDAS